MYIFSQGLHLKVVLLLLVVFLAERSCVDGLGAVWLAAGPSTMMLYTTTTSLYSRIIAPIRCAESMRTVHVVFLAELSCVHRVGAAWFGAGSTTVVSFA